MTDIKIPSADSISKTRLKSFFQFGLVNILRNLLGLVRAKTIALWFGGSGVGILGQYIALFNLQSKIAMFGATASMINSHHMAEEKSWDTRKLLFYHFLIIFLSNLLVAGILFLNLNKINTLIFANEVDNDFLLVVIIVGVIYSATTYLEMIVQAQKKFKLLSRGRNISIFIALLTCVPFIYFGGISGLLYNLAILYLVSFLYFFVMFRKDKLFIISFPVKNDLPMIRYIFKVSITDLTRSFMVMGSILIGKTIIVNSLGMIKNGYLQSIWSIANYINVLSTGFMVYYFPIINSQKDHESIQEELNASFKLLISILFPLILFLMLIPRFLIIILYTKEFLVVAPYLNLLLLSKFLELFYYFYTINFLGRNQFRNFIKLEGLRSVFFIAVIKCFVSQFDISGAIWAIVTTEIFSIGIVLILLRKNKSLYLNRKNFMFYLKVLLLFILVVFIPLNILYKIPFILIYILLFLDIKYYFSLLPIREK
jgi:O-antigen/teichoic acid export membrane protein